MATRIKNSGEIKQAPCPCLARFNAQQSSTAPIEYPSFENHCLAVEGEAALPLTDQAVFCLSGSYALCDRFRSAYPHAQPPALPFPEAMHAIAAPVSANPIDDTVPLAEESWASPTNPLADAESGWSYRPSRPTWAWAGAAAIFAAVLLLGGSWAAYIGWQLVSQEQLLTSRQPGQINTLANAPTQAPAIIVVTAISEQPTSASSVPVPDAGQPAVNPPADANDNAQSFPAAVTPTPIVVQPPAASDQQPPAQPVPTDAPANILLPTTTGSNADAATPVPLINVLVEVPTRRATPEFDLPTSTAVPLDDTATPLPTPTLEILGTPVVIFGPDLSAIGPGECTNVRWHVENVREVYYDNIAAFGDGSERECVDEEPESYALRVHFADGQTKIYTATINIAWPTPTITPTPVFTPEPIATPTWTQVPPTLSPTPVVVYGVSLRLNDSNRQSCVTGVDCEIAVLATNMGDKPDTLSVEIQQRGAGSAWLCRQDGVCAEQRLSLSNVGAGNTAFIVLRLTLPADSAGTVQTYTLRAISDGSLGAIASESVTLEVESRSP